MAAACATMVPQILVLVEPSLLVHDCLFCNQPLYLEAFRYLPKAVTALFQSINQSIYLTNCAQNMYMEQEMI